MSKQNKNYPSVVITGGGLSGLVLSILLARAGFGVRLVEKGQYPSHKVCGEYVSNEALPFLSGLGLKLTELNPSQISRLVVSSPSGRCFRAPLDLGGFGLSRFSFDYALFQLAVSEGVEFLLGQKVNAITSVDNRFETRLADGNTLFSDFAIAAYGKRANLDRSRAFFYRRSPYTGVKYHIRTDFPKDVIQLDNFRGGYSGLVKVDHDDYCLCYLSESAGLRHYGFVRALEEAVLFENPHLKALFKNSDFLWDKPEVISEVSFASKSLVENHILYCGDAAGMISPLCGNGMAMAIHGAKLLAETIVEFKDNRQQLEKVYQEKWKANFSGRLRAGRLTQRLFGNPILSEFAVSAMDTFPPLANLIMKQTHGRPF